MRKLIAIVESCPCGRHLYHYHLTLTMPTTRHTDMPRNTSQYPGYTHCCIYAFEPVLEAGGRYMSNPAELHLPPPKSLGTHAALQSVTDRLMGKRP